VHDHTCLPFLCVSCFLLWCGVGCAAPFGRGPERGVIAGIVLLVLVGAGGHWGGDLVGAQEGEPASRRCTPSSSACSEHEGARLPM